MHIYVYIHTYTYMDAYVHTYMYLRTLHTEAHFVPDSVSTWSMRTSQTDSVGRVVLTSPVTSMHACANVLHTMYIPYLLIRTSITKKILHYRNIPIMMVKIAIDYI